MSEYTDKFKYTINVYKKGRLYTSDEYSPEDFNFMTPEELHVSYLGDKYEIIMDTGTEKHTYPAMNYDMFVRIFNQFHG